MAKKSIKEAEKEAEKDIEEEEESSSDADEEEEEESSEESEEEEEHEEPPPAATARSSEARRAARKAERARAQVHDDHGHGHGHDDDEETDGEDPTWWAPHAVMSALVLIGVLGFFGMFNKVLGRFAAHPAGEPEKPVAAQEATPPPQPIRPPTPPGMPGAADQREMFGAKHLLVMYKGSRRAPENITRSKDEAKARATEAMKKAKDSKNHKFEDLVKEYSDEPNAGARGGDLGKFPKGAMVPEFQNALDKMKVGDVSDLVETPFGYHVILRTQ